MKIFIKIIALVMILSCAFGLTACAGKEKKDDNVKEEQADKNKDKEKDSAEETTTYEDIDPETEKELTVKIVDNDGNPVEGVTVQVFGEAICHKVVSDENGCAVFGKDLFKGIFAGYQLSLESCPEGYSFEYVGDKKLRLNKGMTDLEIRLTKDN